MNIRKIITKLCTYKSVWTEWEGPRSKIRLFFSLLGNPGIGICKTETITPTHGAVRRVDEIICLKCLTQNLAYSRCYNNYFCIVTKGKNLGRKIWCSHKKRITQKTEIKAGNVQKCVILKARNIQKHVVPLRVTPSDGESKCFYEQIFWEDDTWVCITDLLSFPSPTMHYPQNKANPGRAWKGHVMAPLPWVKGKKRTLLTTAVGRSQAPDRESNRLKPKTVPQTWG